MKIKFDYVECHYNFKNPKNEEFLPRFTPRIIEFEGNLKEFRAIEELNILVPLIRFGR